MIVRFGNMANGVSRMREEMDRVFGELFENLPGVGVLPRGLVPPMNVWEDEEHVFVETELPGLRLEDIDVSILGNEITLKGERKSAVPTDESVHRNERRVGVFCRTLELPVSVDTDKTEATFKDGVLLLKLAKSSQARPRKIEVTGS